MDIVSSFGKMKGFRPRDDNGDDGNSESDAEKGLPLLGKIPERRIRSVEEKQTFEKKRKKKKKKNEKIENKDDLIKKFEPKVSKFSGVLIVVQIFVVWIKDPR